MTDRPHNNQQEDEIDLIALAARIRSTIFRYRILIVIWIVVGIALGFGYYQVKPSVYESQMIVRSEILGESLLSVINTNYEKLLNESNPEVLSRKFGLSEDLISSVESISIEPTKGEGEKVAEFYTLNITSLNNDKWGEIQEAVVNSLEENAFVKKRIALQGEQYQNMINKIKAEIKDLEKVKENDPSGAGVVVMNPSEIYSTLVQLYKQQQEYEQDLALLSSIEIVETFDTYERPVSPRPVMSMAVGALLGLFVSLILIVLREFNKYVKKHQLA
ncbi:hypothetical protein E1176_05305 [Fulvivirga sp. RKSG066]|uniref:GNVR domain-containing protein n=1 Tax=Fulvivirga aurantia TaxID=2529383 RepID=UPI0012BD176F|nr:GNVR domain-containing protein [Fulvivirga aurantia]MTI20433.1 hypothetical protein [Fulvivirga aurantia]